MAIPKSVTDRELGKFVEEPSGEVSVRVKVANTDDHSIPVHITSGNLSQYTKVDLYNEALAVASGSPTDIITYTVPVGKTLQLLTCEAYGENIADFKVKLDGNIKARKRTYFGGLLGVDFNFFKADNSGLEAVAGSIITITVEHSRPSTADFNARLNGVLI